MLIQTYPKQKGRQKSTTDVSFRSMEPQIGFVLKKGFLNGYDHWGFARKATQRVQRRTDGNVRRFCACFHTAMNDLRASIIYFSDTTAIIPS